MSERGQIGQIKGIGQSPRSMEIWIHKNGMILINGRMIRHFCKRGFYAFLFELKEDKYLIFRSGPYFFSNKGIYINSWTLDLDLDSDIPSIVLVWVRMSHIPLHCWGDDTLKYISNKL